MRTRALLAASIALILAATSPPANAVGTKTMEKQQFVKQLGAPEISTFIMVSNFPTPNVTFMPAIAAGVNAEQSIELAGDTPTLDKVASNGRSTSTVQYANGPPMSQQTMLLAFESTTTTALAGYDAFLHGTPPTEVAAGTTVYGASEHVAYLRPSQMMFNSAATYSMTTGTLGRTGYNLART